MLLWKFSIKSLKGTYDYDTYNWLGLGLLTVLPTVIFDIYLGDVYNSYG
jgi:hypothetical protein